MVGSQGGKLKLSFIYIYIYIYKMGSRYTWCNFTRNTFFLTIDRKR